MSSRLTDSAFAVAVRDSAVVERYWRLAVIVALTVFAYFSAISRDQALPWAMAALLAATGIVSYLAPRWQVRKLHVKRFAPAQAQEGQMITLNVELHNPSLSPRFMVEVFDHLPFTALASMSEQGNDDATSWQQLGVLAYLPAHAQRDFAVTLPCHKRGQYQLGPLGLRSAFPLGLYEAWNGQATDDEAHLLVYPQTFPIVAFPLRGAELEAQRGGNLLTEGSGNAEFTNLREYRRGDHPRHIHWFSTARRGELMVKEYEPLASARVTLVLDREKRHNFGQGREATFEYAVKITASVARYCCTEQIPYRLAEISGAAGSELGRLGSDQVHFQQNLDYLARVSCGSNVLYPETISKLSSEVCAGETVVLFLSKQSPAILAAIGLLRSRRVNLVAIIFDSKTFATPAQHNHLNHDSKVEVLHSALISFGAHCFVIKQGDDLMQVFSQ